MNNTKAHQKLVDDLLFELGRLPHVRVWPVVVGTFRRLHDERKVKIGMRGMADISGIVLDVASGIRLEIECKTGSGKLSNDQKNWKDMIEKLGGIYIQARSVERVLTELDRYI